MRELLICLTASLLLLSAAVCPLISADSGRARVVAQGNTKSESADSATDPKSAGRTKSAKNRATPGVTPEREAAVMTFVQQHHSELAKLLTQLKEHNSQEYQKAIRDLFKASERLALVHERDSDRYDLELKLWQVQSRIDLLSARIKMSEGDDLRAELRTAIREQHDLRRALLKLERDRTEEKLRKLDDQLKSTAGSNDDAVERQLRSLIGTPEKPTKSPSKDDTKGKVRSAK